MPRGRTVVQQEHYENDLLHGPAECVDCDHDDGDMPHGGRCRAVFERDRLRVSEVFTKEGVRVLHITFRDRTDEKGARNLVTGEHAVLYAGEIREWWENGQPKRAGGFIESEKFDSSSYVDHQGYRRLFSAFVQVGPWSTYHDNGQLRTKVSYTNGLPNSTFVHHAENGTVTARGTYAKGKKEGKWQYWHDNGLLLAEGLYRNDLLVGTWKIWGDTEDDREPWVYEDIQEEWKQFWYTLKAHSWHLDDL